MFSQSKQASVDLFICRTESLKNKNQEIFFCFITSFVFNGSFRVRSVFSSKFRCLREKNVSIRTDFADFSNIFLVQWSALKGGLTVSCRNKDSGDVEKRSTKKKLLFS